MCSDSALDRSRKGSNGGLRSSSKTGESKAPAVGQAKNQLRRRVSEEAPAPIRRSSRIRTLMLDAQKPTDGATRKRSNAALGDQASNRNTRIKDPRVSKKESIENRTRNQSDAVKCGKAAVKKALRTFNKYHLHFVQEGNSRKDEKEPSKRGPWRPDLKALNKMKLSDQIPYRTKRIGNLPGIDVGHQFFSRAEMAAVGLHGHWLNGIDYMGYSYKNLEKDKGYNFPLAVSVVLSGQYEDNDDILDKVIYTGQGGNDLLGSKHQVQDQVMAHGNLALKNCYLCKSVVRLIRGHKCSSSHYRKVYTYDGLYTVTKWWPEVGKSGYTVYQYQLERLKGQPTLTTTQVEYIRGNISGVNSEQPGLVCQDISQGQEAIRIPVINLFDDQPVEPAAFVYTKSNLLAKNVELPPNAPGCKCKGKCTNPRSCECAKRNGHDFPYVSLGGGRLLIEPMDVVYECGPNCGCGPGCVNRTSQDELKYRLEVFRTENKGWAVRSQDIIPSGAPVCEYTGILRRNDDLDHVSGNDYIFEIDCWHTMNGIGIRERRSQDVSENNHVEKIDGCSSEHESEFCIDAGRTGNIARFINHSCQPNLFVQCVLSSHHDIRLARVMLFAAENISAMQELTYDYGYELDSVVGADGKVKELPCHCGAEGCRKRLY